MSDFAYYAILAVAVVIGYFGGTRVVHSKADGLLYIGIATLLAMGLG